MATKSEILNAVDQVKEHLALNKSQDAIKLMAQISVAIIENLTDDALIVSKGYAEDVKSLVAAGVINESTSHNLETLIISGVQANNGVDVPRDYVDKAFEVLQDELDIIYNKDKVPDIVLPSKPTPEDDNATTTFGEVDIPDEEPVFLKPDGDVDFREKERHRRRALSRVVRMPSKNNIAKLIAIIIPILLILVLAIVIKGCVAGAANDAHYNEPVDVMDPNDIVTTESTEEETTAYWSGIFEVTGNRVWVRDQANTTSSRKLTGKDKGDLVTVEGEYDEDWAIISFEGGEAFISKDYLKKQVIDTIETTRDAAAELAAQEAEAAAAENVGVNEQ